MIASDIEQIVKSVRFPFFIDKMNKIWNEEQKKRKLFYEQINEQQKAEFIDGEIIIHSPVKNIHNTVSTRLVNLLFPFVAKRDLGYIGYEKLMISLTRNDYEPDICFFTKEKASGFTKSQMRHPAPDFIVEILSPTTEHIDREIKFEDYALHGIGEYWIIDTETEVLEQYLLKEDKFDLNFKANQGVVKSRIIKDFVLYIPALFDEDEWIKEYNKHNSGIEKKD